MHRDGYLTSNALVVTIARHLIGLDMSGGWVLTETINSLI